LKKHIAKRKPLEIASSGSENDNDVSVNIINPPKSKKVYGKVENAHGRAYQKLVERKKKAHKKLKRCRKKQPIRKKYSGE
jgi:hypothetical protein